MNFIFYYSVDIYASVWVFVIVLEHLVLKTRSIWNVSCFYHHKYKLISVLKSKDTNMANWNEMTFDYVR